MNRLTNITVTCIFAAGVAAWAHLQDPAPQQAAPPQPTTQQPPAQQPAADAEGFVTTATGLRYKITAPAGEPATAQAGDWVSVHYTGRLENGQPFDTSTQARPEGRAMTIRPLTFKLGEKRVIAGWEEGILGMKVGEKRTLVIPPDLAYGKQGAGRVIPPDATLTFDVELIGIYREPAPAAAPAQ
jgi:peptidylprolyl isomerase